MGKRKPKRASKALKRYHNDVKAIKKGTGKGYAESRNLWRKAVDAKGGDRNDLNRNTVVKEARRISKGDGKGPGVDLGYTVWVNLLEWFNRAVQEEKEIRLNLKFIDIKSQFLADETEAVSLHQDVRKAGDDFFADDEELGPPSYYWRIGGPPNNPHEVEFLVIGGKDFYSFTWNKK